MAPKTQHSEGEVQKLVQLINEFKVLFLPPVTDDLEPWQLPYADVFAQVSEIERTTFKTYPPVGHLDAAGAARKKLLVREIQVNAAQCKREQDNEAGWINNVASLVLKRLNGFEFVCQCCNKHLWKPDILALSADPREAEDLRRKHHNRTICRCSDIERANATKPNIKRPSIFSNKSDERVLHRDVGLQGVVIDQKYKRPDRVFGLGMTDSFVPYVTRQKKFSPFKEGFTLYPFLIVEAKSEKGGPGFDSIERQSALAIRTCLRLQVDLASESHEHLRPMVWFLGFQGDEWRLYCAIPKGDETSVIDCWHGYLQDPNRALQLLLIIDWICSWARDVYRPAILRCLARESPGPRHVTPAETLYSFQGDGSDSMNGAFPTSLAYRSSTQSSIRSETQVNRQDVVEPSEANDAMDTFPSQIEVTQSNQPTGIEETALQHGTNHLSVMRKIVNTRLEYWFHLQIPESLVALRGFLDTLLPGRTHKEAASQLLDDLYDETDNVIVTLLTLLDLPGFSDDQSQYSDLTGEEPILILLLCQHFLNPENWQIVRTFGCVICTPEAARQLAILAERNSIVHSLSFWRADRCNCLLLAVGQLGMLDARQSVQAAWSREVFRLVGGGSANAAESNHFGWISRDVNGSTHFSYLLSSSAGRGQFRSSYIDELPLPHDNDAPMTRHLVDTTKLNGYPGLLVKRPNSWPENSAPWCYLMFEQQGSGSAEEPSNSAPEKVPVYAEHALSTEDEALLRVWRSRLEY